MDLSHVTNIHIPQGDCKELKINGVTVWSKVQPNYFTIHNLTASAITLNFGIISGDKTHGVIIQSSTDKSTWSTVLDDRGATSIGTGVMTVPANGYLYLKGNNPNGISANNSVYGITTSYTTGTYECSGDITSLMNGVGGDVAIPAYGFYRFFYQNKGMTKAPELPSTTLGARSYYSMFQGCSSLLSAPSILPALTVPEYAYYSMFNGCTVMKTLPSIKGTNFGSNAAYGMFSNCNAATQIPALYVTTAVANSFKNTFSATIFKISETSNSTYKYSWTVPYTGSPVSIASTAFATTFSTSSPVRVPSPEFEYYSNLPVVL